MHRYLTNASAPKFLVNASAPKSLKFVVGALAPKSIKALAPKLLPNVSAPKFPDYNGFCCYLIKVPTLKGFSG